MQISDVSYGAAEPIDVARGPSQTLARIVDGIAEDNFARVALGSLDALFGVGSWSVYHRFSDAPPRMYFSASHGIPDTTQDCFRIYQAGLYRRDATFDAISQHASAAGRALVTRVRASEIGGREHREEIYESHGMVDRLSVLACDGQRGVLAVNLYRHEHQGCYSAADCRVFEQIAAGVLAAVKRHVSLTAGERALVGQAQFVAWLTDYCPALSAREKAVCARLLQGMSYDGIAADLEISVSTVKTYRLRAFERLGIHFRNELFSMYVAGARRGVRAD